MAEYTPSNFLEPAIPVAPGLYDINHEDTENIPVEEKTEAAAAIQLLDGSAQNNPYLEITEKISHRNNALFKVALWKMLDKDKSGAADQGIFQSAPPWPSPDDGDSQNILGTQWKMLRLEKDLEAWPLTRQFIANTPDTELGQIPSLKNIEEVIRAGFPENQREEVEPSQGMTRDEIAARWMERNEEAKQNTGQPESMLEEGEEPLWLPDSVTDAYVGNTLSKGARQVLEEAMRKGIVKLPPRTADMVPTDENWVPPTEQGIIELEPELQGIDRMIGLADGTLATLSGMLAGTIGMPVGAVKGFIKSMIDGTYGSQEGASNAQKEMQGVVQNINPYTPQTEIGAENAKAVGDMLQKLVPVVPLTGELNAFQAGLKTAMPAIEHAATRTVQPIARTAGKTAEVIRSEAVGGMGNKSPSLVEMPPGKKTSIKNDSVHSSVIKESKPPFQNGNNQTTKSVSDTLLEEEVSRKSTVFRVQGGKPPLASRRHIIIEATGNPRINKTTLNISIDTPKHAQYFLRRRLGGEIVSFDIPKWLDNFIEGEAIEQIGYRSNPRNQGGLAPKRVDPTTPGRTYELPEIWSEWLEEYAIKGSGKVQVD